MKRLYVMKSGDSYKIGVSKCPKKRLFNLSLGNRAISLIYKSEEISNAYFVESTLHKLFAKNSDGREWFSGLDESRLLEIVMETVKEFGKKESSEKRVWNKEAEQKIKKIFFDDPIEEIKRKTEEIKRENDAIVEIIALIINHPESKNVVIGLIGIGWGYEEIEYFLKNQLFNNK